MCAAPTATSVLSISAAGIPNPLAFAFSTDPTDPQPPWFLPGITGEKPAGQTYLLHLTTRQRTGEHGLQYQLFVSADLADWHPTELNPTILDPDFDGDGSTCLIRYSVPMPAGTAPLFLRLGVSAP